MDAASPPASAWTPQASPEAPHVRSSSADDDEGQLHPKSAGANKCAVVAPFRERSAPPCAVTKAASAQGAQLGPSNRRHVPLAVGHSKQAIVSSTGTSMPAGGRLVAKPAGSRETTASKQHPTSRHAAASVAAAEAAVSAAAAALVDERDAPAAAPAARRARPGAQHQQAPVHHQQQLLQLQQSEPPQQPQQKQRQQQLKPFRHGPVSSSVPASLHGSAATAEAPGDGDGTLLSSLQVHCIKQLPDPSSPCSKTAAAAPRPGWLADAGTHPTTTARCTADTDKAALEAVLPTWPIPDQQPQHELHSHALLFQSADAQQLSPAVMMATKARSRRLRAERRDAPAAAWQRTTALSTPKPLPRVVLDGGLLLASSPGAVTAADVLLADLSSSGISSIAACSRAAHSIARSPSASAAAASHDPAADGGEEASQLAEIAGFTGAGSAAGDEAAPAGSTAEGVSDAAASLQAGRGPPLGAFVNLSSLDLSDNHISCMAELACLPGLVQLAVSANKLTSLQLRCSSQGCFACGMEDSSQAGDASRADQARGPRPSSEQGPADSTGLTAGTASVVPCPRWHAGFACLAHLDVSYNRIPAEQLLGALSPLGSLPRLAELHAAGNSVAALPARLGPFRVLTQLNLSHNKLPGAAIPQLWQLPALQLLDLAHNPVASVPACTAEAAGGASVCRLVQLNLSHTKVAAAAQLLQLLQLPQLTLLELVGTPLAMACWAGNGPLQELLKPGLQVIIHAAEPRKLWQHSSKPPSKHKLRHEPADDVGSSPLLQPVTVDSMVVPSAVLAAASRNAILGLPHQLLVAAFDRVADGIDRWQLAPVTEEDSSGSWQQPGAAVAAAAADEEEPGQEEEDVPEDQTFMTGVSITGQLPDEAGQEQEAGDAAAGSQAGGQQQQQPAAWMDPTERLAIALGLAVTQLAHYTHKEPSNPDTAIHHLKHALEHPLVDPSAGQQSERHHTSMTAAAAAKQRPRQLQPLAQPIAAGLDTRPLPVQGIDGLLSGMRGRLQILEGTLLQQLHAQARKLSASAHAMSSSAAADAATAAPTAK